MPVTILERTLLFEVLDHIPVKIVGRVLSTCQLLSSHSHRTKTWHISPNVEDCDTSAKDRIFQLHDAATTPDNLDNPRPFIPV